MSVTNFRPGFFLTGSAWLDADGCHVWVAHDCVAERLTVMLPWPIWSSDGLQVEPSVSCDACGFHSVLALGVPDFKYRCMATFATDTDSRWCERVVDHEGTHQAGMVSWGEYSR